MKGYNTIQKQEGYIKSDSPYFSTQSCRKLRNNSYNNYPVIRPKTEITFIEPSIQKPLNRFNYLIYTNKINYCYYI